LLEVRGLSARYGAVAALRDVSLDVRAGELVALIGANGAGKSTLLRTIAGLMTPTAGRVALEGRDVTGQPPEAILRAGIALVPERRRVFADLTVLDNLELGGYALPRGGDFRRRLDAGVDEAYRLFPVLHRRREQLAGTLSGGEQRMLSLARVLVEKPKLLIADELSLGLAPIIVDEVYRTLETIRDAGTTLLLVEQHVHHALAIADDAIVLVKGEVAYSGPVSELGDLQARVLGADPS